MSVRTFQNYLCSSYAIVRFIGKGVIIITLDQRFSIMVLRYSQLARFVRCR